MNFRKILASPLLSFLFVLLAVTTVLLAVPYVMPLPGEAGRSLDVSVVVDSRGASNIASSDFSGALERPLFHVNRRPPQEVVEAVVPVVEKKIEAPFELVGVLGGVDGGRSAYLQHKETGETLSVREGERAGDWQVDTIGQDFVALLMGSERRVVQLANGGG